MTAPASMGVVFGDLQAKLAGLFFGQWGITVPLVLNTPLNAAQIAQVNDCIKDGLMAVYSAHSWSFLRPVISITTNAPYTAGTITVASGVVTLVTGTWPSWLALTSTLVVNGIAYGIASLSPLTLSNPPANITTAVACSLIPSPIYPLSAGFDSIEGPFTYPTGLGWQQFEVQERREVELRADLSRNNTPSPPRFFALQTATFDPTTAPGSLRQVMFYPIPDAAYTLSATMTLRPTMLDATNKYPLGAEVLAPVLLESVLAAAERNLEENVGFHNQQLAPMLAAAILRDKEYSTPSNLGQGRDPECHDSLNRFYHTFPSTINVNIITGPAP